MKRWDVFISHASEDKKTVAMPLANALRRAGLKVWLDKQELTLGDSLREKIDEGLSESSFGIVILSQNFLEKGWPKRELNGLMAIEEGSRKVILPVWHNIDKATLATYSPILADRLAANTENGIRSITDSIIDVVLSQGNDSPSVLKPTLTRRLIELLESNPKQAQIRDFLRSHNRILFRAIGSGGAIGTSCVNPPKINNFAPDFLIMQQVEYIRVTIKISLALGKPTERLFKRDGTLTLRIGRQVSQLKSYLETYIRKGPFNSPKIFGANPSVKGIIIASRRHDLMERDGERLREYNGSNSRIKINRAPAYSIEIRTYDWLIDATLPLGIDLPD